MSYDPNLIRAILKEAKTIAVVGLSDKPDRASYRVAQYLQSKSYQIIPVNPMIKQCLGETSFASLQDIPESMQFDIVDIFSKPEDVREVVEHALPRRPKLIWLQEGIVHEPSKSLAGEAGIPFVQDRCLMIDHANLIS